MSKTIKVGYTYYPMNEILELIKDDIKDEGYNLKIVEYGLIPNNLALRDKEIDANLMQSSIYLEDFNLNHKTSLVHVFKLYHTIYSLYSSEITKLDELKENTLITMPDDNANLTRAFYLLHQANLIEINDINKKVIKEEDIIRNDLNLRFEYFDVNMIANRYLETKYAIMYPTFAKSLNLVGNKDRIYVEEIDEFTKEYAMGLSTYSSNINNDKINILIKHLSSKKVANYLENEYSYASVVAF